MPAGRELQQLFDREHVEVLGDAETAPAPAQVHDQGHKPADPEVMR